VAPNDEDLVPRLVRAWLLRAPDVAQHCIFLIRAHCLLSLAHVELPRTRACPVRSRREGVQRETERKGVHVYSCERERKRDKRSSMYTAVHSNKSTISLLSIPVLDTACRCPLAIPSLCESRPEFFFLSKKGKEQGKQWQGGP